jgi:hypothetical protein
MKYKLINTDLIYKGTLYSEGCILEIDSKDADSISEYLKPVESSQVSHPDTNSHPGLVSGSASNSHPYTDLSVEGSPKQKNSKSNKGKKR